MRNDSVSGIAFDCLVFMSPYKRRTLFTALGDEELSGERCLIDTGWFGCRVRGDSLLLS